MDGTLYYIMLAAIAIIAIQFFRSGHILLAVATLAVGWWVWYSHEENITFKDVQNKAAQSIDEAAKSEYDRKGMKTDAYDYDKEKANSGTTVKKGAE
jgi:lipopolysaccharide export system protein LptC